MRRDLERRLARAENAASATNWTDRWAAGHRNNLRCRVKVCNLIRERFLLMGLDPALAERLRIGEEAAAELAAISDSDTLQTADEAITRTHQENDSEAGPSFKAKIERMAEKYLDGSQPDLAKAPVVELLAFCVAIEKLAWG